MKQQYHVIIRPEANGTYMGWVEEVPGAMSHGRSLAECRQNLRSSLELLIETHRDDARLGLDPTCIREPLEIEVPEPPRGPNYEAMLRGHSA